jgi:hypothetical protein
MKTFFLLAVGLMISAAASAQQYKWVDKNGKVQYGDTPPPGVNATRLRGPTGAPAPAATAAPAGKDGKDAKPAAKGPLTPAQQDAEFRKRQEEADKSRDKQAKSAEEEQAKRENCSSAREQLTVLESGQRVSRTDAKGERFFIDDDQRAADIARARKLVQQWCS